MFWEHREVGVNEFRQRFEQERMRQRQEQGDAPSLADSEPTGNA